MSRHTKASRRAAFRRANTIPTPPVVWRFDVRPFQRGVRAFVRAFRRAARVMYRAVMRALDARPPYFATAHPLP